MHSSTRGLFLAELVLREMRDPSLLVLVDYLELLADARPDKFERAGGGGDPATTVAKRGAEAGS